MSAEKPKDGDVCRICSKSLSGKFFFIELPIEDQLQTIMLHRFNSTMHVHVRIRNTLSTNLLLKAMFRTIPH